MTTVPVVMMGVFTMVVVMRFVIIVDANGDDGDGNRSFGSGQTN